MSDDKDKLKRQYLELAARASGGGLTSEQRDQRIADCENIMLTELNSNQQQAKLSKMWGTTRRTVRKYQQLVRMTWAIEGKLTGTRESRRDEMREVLRTALGMCLRRKTYMPRGKEKEPLEVPDPDMDNAHKFIQTLCEFDGLIDPEHKSREVAVNIMNTTINHVESMSDDQLREQLLKDLPVAEVEDEKDDSV